MAMKKVKIESHPPTAEVYRNGKEEDEKEEEKDGEAQKGSRENFFLPSSSSSSASTHEEADSYWSGIAPTTPLKDTVLWAVQTALYGVLSSELRYKLHYTYIPLPERRSSSPTTARGCQDGNPLPHRRTDDTVRHSTPVHGGSGGTSASDRTSSAEASGFSDGKGDEGNDNDPLRESATQTRSTTALQCSGSEAPFSSFPNPTPHRRSTLPRYGSVAADPWTILQRIQQVRQHHIGLTDPSRVSSLKESRWISRLPDRTTVTPEAHPSPSPSTHGRSRPPPPHHPNSPGEKTAEETPPPSSSSSSSSFWWHFLNPQWWSPTLLASPDGSTNASSMPPSSPTTSGEEENEKGGGPSASRVWKGGSPHVPPPPPEGIIFVSETKTLAVPLVESGESTLLSSCGAPPEHVERRSGEEEAALRAASRVRNYFTGMEEWSEQAEGEEEVHDTVPAASSPPRVRPSQRTPAWGSSGNASRRGVVVPSMVELSYVGYQWWTSTPPAQRTASSSSSSSPSDGIFFSPSEQSFVEAQHFSHHHYRTLYITDSRVAAELFVLCLRGGCIALPHHAKLYALYRPKAKMMKRSDYARLLHANTMVSPLTVVSKLERVQQRFNLDEDLWSALTDGLRPTVSSSSSSVSTLSREGKSGGGEKGGPSEGNGGGWAQLRGVYDRIQAEQEEHLSVSVRGERSGRRERERHQRGPPSSAALARSLASPTMLHERHLACALRFAEASIPYAAVLDEEEEASPFLIGMSLFFLASLSSSSVSSGSSGVWGESHPPFPGLAEAPLTQEDLLAGFLSHRHRRGIVQALGLYVARYVMPPEELPFFFFQAFSETGVVPVSRGNALASLSHPNGGGSVAGASSTVALQALAAMLLEEDEVQEAWLPSVDALWKDDLLFPAIAFFQQFWSTKRMRWARDMNAFPTLDDRRVPAILPHAVPHSGGAEEEEESGASPSPPRGLLSMVMGELRRANLLLRGGTEGHLRSGADGNVLHDERGRTTPPPAGGVQGHGKGVGVFGFRSIRALAQHTLEQSQLAFTASKVKSMSTLLSSRWASNDESWGRGKTESPQHEGEKRKQKEDSGMDGKGSPMRGDREEKDGDAVWSASTSSWAYFTSPTQRVEGASNGGRREIGKGGAREAAGNDWDDAEEDNDDFLLRIQVAPSEEEDGVIGGGGGEGEEGSRASRRREAVQTLGKSARGKLESASTPSSVRPNGVRKPHPSGGGDEDGRRGAGNDSIANAKTVENLHREVQARGYFTLMTLLGRSTPFDPHDEHRVEF